MKFCVKLFETVQLLLDREGASETSRVSLCRILLSNRSAVQTFSTEELPFTYLHWDTERAFWGGGGVGGLLT